MRTRLTVAITAALVVAFAVLVGCGTSTPPPSRTPGTPNVAVSFAPLYCFASGVVGDTGTVKSILSTQGPHGADMSQREVAELAAADVLFLNGLGLDDNLGRKVKDGLGSRGPKVVNLGELLEGSDAHALLLEPSGEPCQHAEGEAHHHADADHDPHVWLSPDLAIKLVELIRQKLTEQYPQHKEAFARNAANYADSLKAIKRDGKEMLKGGAAADRKLVTVHGSMNYFARTFDVTVAGVVQKAAGQEPTPKELSALVDKCRAEKVRVLAVEPQYGTRGAVGPLEEEMRRGGVANPVVIRLDPLETAAAADLMPGWYEARMRANLAELTRAFQ